MGLGPRVTDQVKKMVIRIYLDGITQGNGEHLGGRELSGRQVHAELEAVLASEKKMHFLPKLRTVQKMLYDYRKKDENRPVESKALDEPWSVIALVEHPIPPEAVPLVLEIYMNCVEMPQERDESFKSPLPMAGWYDWPYNVFTIREALWVGNLCKVGFLNKPTAELSDMDLTFLWAVVRTYASMERVAEIMGQKYRDSRLEDPAVLPSLVGARQKRDLKTIKAGLSFLEGSYTLKIGLEPAEYEKVRLKMKAAWAAQAAAQATKATGQEQQQKEA
ncbi:MAG: hypothetical protein HY673_13955 [Chloroflexi bacterium]|nr:hypothetical protein [Chloroflexota bacterium]